MPNAAVIAYATPASLHQAVNELLHNLKTQPKVPQGETATTLMQSASEDLIHVFFTQLMHALEAENPDPAYREIEHLVQDINHKLNQGLSLISGFFKNDRILPAVTHYAGLFIELPRDGELAPHIAVELPDAVLLKAEAACAALREGRANDASEGIDVLTDIIHLAFAQLLVKPKQLMKFNFVVDKTVSGVINLAESLTFRSLRKLGEHIPPSQYAVLAQHIEGFVFKHAKSVAA